MDIENDGDGHPLISIIIPVKGHPDYLKQCLMAIDNQKRKNFECIIVIDGPDNEVRRVASDFDFRIIELPENRGPAFARNTGAEHSYGGILLFVDSDMVLFDSATDVVEQYFKDPDICVLQGVYDKYPANDGFIPKFIALKKWIEYSPNRSKEIHHIGSELFAIRRDVFFKIGMFNTEYRKPTVEDYELGHRLDKQYRIIMTSDLRGRHFFPGFKKLVKNYYIRSKEWTKLIITERRYKLDAGATNFTSILSSIITILLIIISITAFISILIDNTDQSIPSFIYAIIKYAEKISIYAIPSFIIILPGLNIKYLNVYIGEYGFIFGIRAFLVLLTLDITILIGAFVGLIERIFSKTK